MRNDCLVRGREREGEKGRITLYPIDDPVFAREGYTVTYNQPATLARSAGGYPTPLRVTIETKGGGGEGAKATVLRITRADAF